MLLGIRTIHACTAYYSLFRSLYHVLRQRQEEDRKQSFTSLLNIGSQVRHHNNVRKHMDINNSSREQPFYHQQF